MERPIFIWGAPRSGTTLLYQLITHHPHVGYLRSEEGRPLEGTRLWWQVFGEHRGVMDVSLACPSKVKQICNEYASLLRQRSKSRLLDKSPFMTLWIPLINKVFPDARHIHIIRDGKAVVNSILYKLRYSPQEKDVPFREGKVMFGPHPPELIDPMSLQPALRHARQWIMLVEHGRHCRKILGERYCELRYEDVVSATPTTMRMILRHAQLPLNEEYLNEVYPHTLENRNYKWKGEKKSAMDDGYTAHRAFESEDIPYLSEMNPLLRSLGYEEL